MPQPCRYCIVAYKGIASFGVSEGTNRFDYIRSSQSWYESSLFVRALTAASESQCLGAAFRAAGLSFLSALPRITANVSFTTMKTESSFCRVKTAQYRSHTLSSLGAQNHAVYVCPYGLRRTFLCRQHWFQRLNHTSLADNLTVTFSGVPS